MMYVWALALAGLFLLYLEFFLPRKVMAMFGALSLIGSAVLFHVMKPKATHMILYLMALSGAIFVLVRFAAWRLKAGQKKDSEE